MKQILLTLFALCMLSAVMWAQNGEPEIIDSNQLTFALQSNQLAVSNGYGYTRNTLPTASLCQFDLTTRQSNWIRNINTIYNGTVMDGHGLAVTPSGNICYPDGADIIVVSEQNEVLWSRSLAPYLTGGIGFTITAAEQYLIAYSMGSDLILLDYTTGQVINYWHIPTSGLSSCGDHSAFAATDSVFYCVDGMPMGVVYNTGNKLTKVKIVNGVPQIIWEHEIPDMSDSRVAIDGNTIFLQGRQVDPWCNSIIDVIIDDGESYHLNATINVSGPDSVTIVNGMRIWNHKLLVAAQTRIGDDPNFTGGRFASTIVYNTNGSVYWRINQYMSQFCANYAVTFNTHTIYVLGASRPTYEAWQQQVMWLTEISAPVSIHDPIIPPIPSILTCYPNPFQGITSIKFNQTETSPTTLTVYNIKGQLVRTLVNSQKYLIGEYTVTWDGRADNGSKVAHGIYFVQLEIGKYKEIRKAVLTR